MKTPASRSNEFHLQNFQIVPKLIPHYIFPSLSHIYTAISVKAGQLENFISRPE